MKTTYFKATSKEYCHVNDEFIFIFNSKEPTRIPLEFDLSETWGIASMINYIVFGLLLLYTGFSVLYYKINYFKYPVNYGALFLLFLTLKRINDGMHASKTPTIRRSSIKSASIQTPWFSFPRLVVYFDGPEGKVLKRSISIYRKKEAIQVLTEAGVIKS
jgi:hypothetical protein